jgi:hypothetical protein
MKATNQKIWAIVGKIGVILALIVAGFQIYQHFLHHPGAQLRVKGTCCTINLPTHFEDAINIARDAELFTFYENNKYATDGESATEYSRISDHWSIPNYYIEVVIFNEGDRQANDVMLDFTGEGFACISLNDTLPVETAFRNSLRIGELRQGSDVLIQLWVCNIFPLYQLEDMRVTYSEGIVSVEFPTVATGISKYIQEHENLIIMGFLIGCIILTLYIANKIMNKLDKKSSETDSKQTD